MVCAPTDPRSCTSRRWDLQSSAAPPLEACLILRPPGAGSSSEQKPSALKALLTPFSDSAANAKLLALCGAGALSSVATLIHDTYLPIYLSEVLGLSNTKVRT